MCNLSISSLFITNNHQSISPEEMAPVQLKYVVSFTSQDDVHKANNLLCSDAHKKWLAHPKDRSGRIEIIFQLEEQCQFSFIDVGTVWCACLEIRAGRSDWPQSEAYKTLVPTVNLMSPIDCQLGRKTSSTTMFSKSNFSMAIANRQWDRLQIICRQPFRKDVQMGISFVKVRNAETTSKATPEGKNGTAKRSSLPPSVASIQKHFFGKSEEKEDDYAESLKYKLLQMSNSSASENVCDVVHEQALSRTAQLVLKASEISQNTTKHYKIMAKKARRGLFSGSVIGKEHIKINEEISAFLPTLKINLSNLDAITVADLRHKFERFKKRKLTVEEKHIFSTECQSFICSLVDDKNGKGADKETDGRSFIPTKLTSSKSENDGNISSNRPRASLTCGFLKKDTVPPDTENLSSSMQKTRMAINFSKNSPSTKLKSLQCSSSAASTVSRSVKDAAEVSNSGVGPHWCERNNDIGAKNKMKVISSDFKLKEKDKKTAKKEQLNKNLSVEISNEDDDNSILSESSISYDEDDEVIRNVSENNMNSSPGRPKLSERGRTLQEVNEAYARLYQSNPSLTAKDDPVVKGSSNHKRKQLSQSSLDLLNLFESEMSDDEGHTPLERPWLSKTNDSTPQNNVSKVGAKSEKKHSNKKANKKRNVISKKNLDFDSVNTVLKASATPVNALQGSRKTSTPICSTQNHLNQNIESPGKLRFGTGGFSSGQELQASMLLCPTCDVLIPAETYHSHISACIESQMLIGESTSEAAIDKTEQFQECPICLERFHLDVLLVHASECGL